VFVCRLVYPFLVKYRYRYELTRKSIRTGKIATKKNVVKKFPNEIRKAVCLRKNPYRFAYVMPSRVRPSDDSAGVFDVAANDSRGIEPSEFVGIE